MYTSIMLWILFMQSSSWYAVVGSTYNEKETSAYHNKIIYFSWNDASQHIT